MLVANLETATVTRAYAIVRFCAVASELHSAISASGRGSLDCRSRGGQNRLRRASAPTEPVTSAFSSVVAGCPLGHSREGKVQRCRRRTSPVGHSRVFGCLRPSDRCYRPVGWRRAIALAVKANSAGCDCLLRGGMLCPAGSGRFCHDNLSYAPTEGCCSRSRSLIASLTVEAARSTTAGCARARTARIVPCATRAAAAMSRCTRPSRPARPTACS
jgi:hypothetical protein